jgi:ribosome biogenesis GTPase / thiamine phosphate phosphatase
MSEGLVTKSTGSWYTVRTADGEKVFCRVRGRLRIRDLRVTNPVAVGDRVTFGLEKDGNGNILDVQPRENYLIRRSARKSAHGHILAANIDQAVLVATLSFPRTSLGFIDRFLVAAESFRIPSLLVYNKSDRWEAEDRALITELREVYQIAGVRFLEISARQGQGMEELRKELKSKISLLAGHSGVGKSTILNTLSPDIRQKTAEVSAFADKGVHSTTFAEMFELEPDTFLIDTPGIKELGLIDFYDEEIHHYFPEIRAYFGRCKYYNCTHTHEPGCAVIAAVEEGRIAASRYQSYLSIVFEEDNRR